MAFVLQMQPGAITDLAPYARNIAGRLPADGQFTTEDGQPLYFWGISPGVGTCACGRTAVVAVFGRDDPGERRRGRENLPASAFAVLARALSPEEFQAARRRFSSSCLAGVELLEMVQRCGPQVVFRRTGRLAVYVSLV